jgi:putative hemolysin
VQPLMDEILIILLLIVFNGIFAMSEIAVIQARKTTLSNDEKKGSRGARTALRLANDPDRFLSTVQIGITLIGILTGIYSGASLSGRFSDVFESFGMPERWAYPLAQGLIVIIVTYLTIVFGELVPKRIGMSVAERVSKVIARPMYILSVIASPFVWILSKSTEAMVNLLGVKDAETKVTEEDIKSIVQEGKEDGEVQEVEQDIVERVFMLGDLTVDSIMTHRSDVVTLDVSMTKDEIKQVLNDNLYEAYPLIDRGIDNILGVVLLKDLLFRLDGDTPDLKTLMHPAVYFYENMSVYKALEQMKEKRLTQAFICDEFGSFQGIVTLRDILEGLVGTIDEVAEDPEIVKREGSESWLVDGQCSFYDFLSYFDKEDLYDNEQQDYNTLAGLIIEQLKHIPQAGERTEWNCFNFEIVDMDGVRIDKVLVTMKEESKE